MRAARHSALVWGPPPADLDLPDGDVHVWRAALDLPAPSLQFLQRTLAPGESSRADRIQDPTRRDRFIAAHGLLRAILSRYAGAEPRELSFSYGPYGKPALAGDLEFNLAHSHGLALVAVARGRELGVDLERIRWSGGWEQIAARCLSAGERAAIGALPTRVRPAALFNYWVCKEAYLKAIGAGLSRPLSQVAIALRADGTAALCGDAGTGWSIRTLPLDRDYAAALAVEGHGWQLRCWEWPADMEAH